jgi:tRNA A-37 threonylcarbamoyl transferase component Bud32
MQALSEMHKQQIYHYDLKPENIIVSEFAQGNLSYNINLIDFSFFMLISRRCECYYSGFWKCSF